MKAYSPFAACLLSAGLLVGAHPVMAAAQTYIQPPIVWWSQAPHAASMPTPAASAPSSPAPAASPPAAPATETIRPIHLAAPVENPAPAAAAVPLPTPPAAAIPTPPPPSSAAAILAFQAQNEDPGHFQPILGAEATRSYARYLKSFTHPIPESFASGAAQGGGVAAGAGNSAGAMGVGGGYGSAQ